MYNIRVRFIRGEEIKFISHLDLMRAFERAIRRSGLPIAYSQGFNPHQQMVFGLPLSVGVTSEAEYGDFELTEQIEPHAFLERLNAQLPKGLLITKAVSRSTNENIMAAISASAYEILIYVENFLDGEAFKNSIDSMLSLTEINVIKEGKNGNKRVNIRPMIQTLGVKSVVPDELMEQGNSTEGKGGLSPWIENYVRKLVVTGEYDAYYITGSLFCISALLNAGSKSNLKPELLVTAISEALGKKTRIIKIHRKELFVELDGELCSPLDKRVLSGS